MAMDFLTKRRLTLSPQTTVCGCQLDRWLSFALSLSLSRFDSPTMHTCARIAFFLCPLSECCSSFLLPLVSPSLLKSAEANGPVLDLATLSPFPTVERLLARTLRKGRRAVRARTDKEGPRSGCETRSKSDSNGKQ